MWHKMRWVKVKPKQTDSIYFYDLLNPALVEIVGVEYHVYKVKNEAVQQVYLITGSGNKYILLEGTEDEDFFIQAGIDI